MLTIDNIRKSQMRNAKAQEDIYHAYAVKHGVSDSFLFLMYVFHEDGDGVTQAEMGQILNVPKQTVNSALKKMESDGLIYLANDEKDKKKKRVFLTETGHKIMRLLIEPLIEAENMAYESIGQNKAAMMAELARQETDALKEQIGRIK
ncbi:MAG: MarR family transcriptional regulator [Oscillospiraceae bacterium]|nr:winged helix DNA-binding protein [Oscillospiraceae bacterium]MDO5137560.1 MarR family transcriptional regulator [Oscillospiraceae bacterium]